jgi:hypothetical protein
MNTRTRIAFASHTRPALALIPVATLTFAACGSSNADQASSTTPLAPAATSPSTTESPTTIEATTTTAAPFTVEAKGSWTDSPATVDSVLADTSLNLHGTTAWTGDLAGTEQWAGNYVLPDADRCWDGTVMISRFG